MIAGVWLFLVSFTVLGTLFYNISVKLAGDEINAFVFTVILTATAMVGHVAAFLVNKAFFTPDLKFAVAPYGLTLAVIAGIGVVIIDLAYFYAVKSGGLAITNAFWVIGGLLATVGISVLFLNEQMTLMRLAGIGLGVCSLVLLSRS